MNVSKRAQRVIWILLAGALAALFLQWAIPALLAYGLAKAAVDVVVFVLMAVVVGVGGTIIGTIALIMFFYFNWLFNGKDHLAER